jgi:hypothetical protein
MFVNNTKNRRASAALGFQLAHLRSAHAHGGELCEHKKRVQEQQQEKNKNID